MLYTLPAHAAVPPKASATSVYLDDRPLQLGAQPLLVNDTMLVPMRQLFEGQGAKISWNNVTKTVQGTKDDLVLTYKVGNLVADKNGQTLSLRVPGKIINGNTMLPLRFVSEALGSTVKWDANTHVVRIYSPVKLNTTIQSEVNLRNTPDSSDDATIQQTLPAGQMVQVVREVDANWLEARTADNKSGYISAKPKYTDYTSDSLADQQGSALLTFGDQYLGTPYEFGASLKQTATFDCSSFVHHVFMEVLSIDLPRTSYDQAKKGKEVALKDLRKGDLLFFSARGLPIGHVGIYAGNNRILHTYSKERGVHYEDFSEKWKKRFVTARRMF